MITHSELFFTAVTQFETLVNFSDGIQPTGNANSPLIAIPASILSVFTSPVYWNTYNDGKQTQFFWDKNQSANPWITQADASGQINTVQFETDSPVQFYQNPNCLTQVKLYQQGNFDRSAPGTTLLPGATSQSPVSGRLILDVIWAQTFQGDCAGDLQTLANCYKDGSNCDSDQISRAQLFELFVTGTQALDLNQASKIIGLAYDVHFE